MDGLTANACSTLRPGAGRRRARCLQAPNGGADSRAVKPTAPLSWRLVAATTALVTAACASRPNVIARPPPFPRPDGAGSQASRHTIETTALSAASLQAALRSARDTVPARRHAAGHRIRLQRSRALCLSRAAGRDSENRCRTGSSGPQRRARRSQAGRLALLCARRSRTDARRVGYRSGPVHSRSRDWWRCPCRAIHHALLGIALRGSSADVNGRLGSQLAQDLRPRRRGGLLGEWRGCRFLRRIQVLAHPASGLRTQPRQGWPMARRPYGRG